MNPKDVIADYRSLTRRSALKIAAIYTLLGGLWIFFSDQLVSALIRDHGMLTIISIYKGWGYILVTALLLYWLIRRDTAALCESEEKFSKIFYASPMPVSITRASDGRYVDVNDAFLKRMGYRRDEIVGHSSLELGLWADPAKRGDMFNILGRQEALRDFEAHFRTKSGEIGTAVLFREVIQLQGQKHLIGTSLDITERKRSEEALRASEARFSTVFHHSPTSIIVSEIEDGKLIDANEAFFKMTGYTREEALGRTSLELNFWVDPEERERLVQAMNEYGRVRDFELRLRRKSGEIIYALYSADRVELDGKPYILTSSSNITERKQAEEALAQAYDATIEGWSRAMDLRDKETEGHTQRVTTETVKLARLIGIDDETLTHFRRGALLHDIGKIGVPDRILLKDEELGPDEWEVMRLHPVFAYEMLVAIEFLQPALDIPYCHHERWDGSGYPRMLRGEEIPLAARIFAVVDVYDALTSDRPYRAAWSKEKTLEYIRQRSGQDFDPHVVELFLRMQMG